MYLEIGKAGGFLNALNIEFTKISSILRVTVDDDLIKVPFTYSRIEKDNKFSQVYIAEKEELYLPDFWRDGVCSSTGRNQEYNRTWTSIRFLAL